ncbi:cell wall hydrolase [Roseomonas sp. NAR14]|uniref:Cell wall hydrolase n=1 Tax=Roseomonas acroporae TaxID=2937791 RepID=A0A9X1Y501_9PROT|nr:cell wall hydrolase [Roseomonas acroporae]MCK8784339.1 cell wall hydrolase [Roseomonas acroporae]
MSAASNAALPPAAARHDAAQTIAVLARTLWAEAGTRPVRAIEALAALVVNRARITAAPGEVQQRARHWGQGIAGVCRAPFQFPCWNPNHPRHRAMLAVPEGDGALAICRRIAARAVAGALPDPTGGATHYHDAAILPGWAVGEVPLAECGGMVFYGLEGRDGAGRPARPGPGLAVV